MQPAANWMLQDCSATCVLPIVHRWWRPPFGHVLTSSGIKWMQGNASSCYPPPGNPAPSIAPVGIPPTASLSPHTYPSTTASTSSGKCLALAGCCWGRLCLAAPLACHCSWGTPVPSPRHLVAKPLPGPCHSQPTMAQAFVPCNPPHR